MCNIRTSVRLCFGVSCDICAGAIVLTSRLAIAPGHRIRRICRAWPSCRGRGYGVPGRGRRAWASCLGAVAYVSMWSMDVSPSCGCDTPTNVSVCNGFGVVYVTRFALLL